MVSRQLGRLGQVWLAPLAHMITQISQHLLALRASQAAQIAQLILESNVRLETDTNMVMRFVIGQTSDLAQEADLVAESSQHGGFMRLHLQVHLPAPLFF